MNEKDILELIKNDEWMMNILRAARSLNLPDWWIGAGFVRSKIWDYLHVYTESTPLPDIDVIYFDPDNLAESLEKEFDAQLTKLIPGQKWSSKNQARMHVTKGDQPYTSAAEGLSKWSEIPTCIGVRLLSNDELSLVAPWGIDDFNQLTIRSNPACKSNPQLFIERMKVKNWTQTWPKLKIIWPL